MRDQPVEQMVREVRFGPPSHHWESSTPRIGFRGIRDRSEDLPLSWRSFGPQSIDPSTKLVCVLFRARTTLGIYFLSHRTNSANEHTWGYQVWKTLKPCWALRSQLFRNPFGFRAGVSPLHPRQTLCVL